MPLLSVLLFLVQTRRCRSGTEPRVSACSDRAKGECPSVFEWAPGPASAHHHLCLPQLGALARGSSRQAPLPIRMTHKKGAGLNWRPFKAFTEATQTSLVCFYPMRYSDENKFSNLMGCVIVANWVENLIDLVFRRNLGCLQDKTNVKCQTSDQRENSVRAAVWTLVHERSSQKCFELKIT